MNRKVNYICLALNRCAVYEFSLRSTTSSPPLKTRSPTTNAGAARGAD